MEEGGSATSRAYSWAVNLRADNDAVVNLGNTRRSPRLPPRFLSLRPRPNGAFEDHLATLGFHGDPVRVDLGRARERVLDLTFDFRRLHARLDDDRIDHATDTLEPAHGRFRDTFLIVPLDISFESNPAVLDDHAGIFGRKR